MKDVRPRERVVPDTNTQVMNFARTALPPLIAHYAFRFMRTAVALPQVRAILVALGLMAAAFLLGPALVIGLIAYWATGDSAQATTTAVVMIVIAAGILGVLLAKLYGRWKAFRRRYIGI